MCLKNIELDHATYWLFCYDDGSSITSLTIVIFYLFPIATKLKEVEQIIVNKEKTEEGKAQALKLQAKLNGEQELVFSIGRYTKKNLHFFQAVVYLTFNGYFCFNWSRCNRRKILF